jgi:hypothetical protein
MRTPTGPLCAALGDDRWTLIILDSCCSAPFFVFHISDGEGREAEGVKQNNVSNGNLDRR